MAKPIKITYKKTKRPSGLAGVGWGWRFDAKIKGKVFAHASGGRALDGRVTIQIAVKKQSDSKSWDWIFPKHNCTNEEECKAYLEGVIDQIMAKYELHLFERD